MNNFAGLTQCSRRNPWYRFLVDPQIYRSGPSSPRGFAFCELFTMKQDPVETFRTFSAKIQGKAEVCEFKTYFDTSCSNCNTALSGHTYYTDEVIHDVLINGIADSNTT